MDARVAKNAVVQYNTAQPGEFFYLAEVMQVGRQVASAQPGCGAAFGGEVDACKGVGEGVMRLFSLHSPTRPPAEKNLRGPAPAGALSAAEARIECGRLGVDDLVATRWDAVWFDSQGWAWSLPAVVDTNEVRVVDCAAPMR
jgi:hypothetical protein